MLFISALTPAARDESTCKADIEFALDELEKRCGHFFQQKKIDWKRVRKEMLKASKKVETDEEHHELLWRLLARLRDGHARVDKIGAGKEIRDPERWSNQTGIGMFLCRSGEKILIKSSWNVAASNGIEPGMELVKVDGVAIGKWIPKEIERLRDEWSFSTDQHAFGFLTTKGLWREPGTRLKLELRTSKGKKKSRTLTYKRSTSSAFGPAFFPPGLESAGESVKYGKVPEGFGYIHLRRIRRGLLDEVDTALERIGNVPGLILDFRANSGGGCDHDALLGRFVPHGENLKRASAYPIPSAGSHPYGGPVVVIVDSNVVSAGETTSGMFKEDGRGYMIGDGMTAGMSSQKETINLPSGLFALYVSVASNKRRFNGGRGIEGIGIEPHEIVEYDQEDLEQGVDTLTQRAVELLRDFPQRKVPYQPDKHGWKPGPE